MMLYHYFDSTIGPFRNLSDLPEEEDIMNDEKTMRILKNHFTKRLKRALKKRGEKDAAVLTRQYEARFQKYMKEADFGEENQRFTSFLNIYLGLAAYELLREKGYSQEEAIVVYDEMSRTMRRIAALSYRLVDLLPGGFGAAVKSIRDDLLGPKAVCWDTTVTEDSERCFEYKITKCLYYDTCKAHGFPEFTRVFCEHDRHAYDVLHRQAKFVRYSAIGEGGEICHDVFINVKSAKHTGGK